MSVDDTVNLGYVLLCYMRAVSPQQLLSDACDPDLTVKLMLPTIINMGKDQVANVRFNVAKTLQKLGERLDQT